MTVTGRSTARTRWQDEQHDQTALSFRTVHGLEMYGGFISSQKPPSEILDFKGSRSEDYIHSIHDGGSGGTVYDWEGDLRIGGRQGADQIHGYGGHDYLSGDDDNDTLFGEDCADVLSGGAGNDHLDGGIGGDLLYGGSGQDWLTGGSGADEFHYTSADESKPDTAKRDHILDLNAADGDVIALWLPFVGNTWTTFRFVDAFTGHLGELVQQAFDGHVLLSGDGDGDGKADFQIEVENRTVLTGDDFMDTIYDGDVWATNGVVAGGPLRDQFYLFGGGKQIVGGGGGDIFLIYNGYQGPPKAADIIVDFNSAEGDKLDLTYLDYYYSSLPATFSLGGSTFTGTGNEIIQAPDGHGNTLVSFDINGDKVSDYNILLAGAPILTGEDFVETESRIATHYGNTVTGGTIRDILYGAGGDDILNGNQGDDVLSGDSGNDTLTGGQGTDALFGGVGTDLFVFRTTVGTAPGTGTRDVIGDFNHDEGDRIDLSNIDADISAAGNQAFHLVAGPFGGIAGELIQYQDQGATIVAGDVNGDGLADFEIQLAGAPILVSADFIL